MTPASDGILPAPTVSYLILHQPSASTGKQEYAATMKALHGRLAEEAGAVRAAHEKARHDHLVRESQALLSLLNPFLETPLATDQAEVGRIVLEALERAAADAPSVPFPRLQSSLEGRFLVPSFSSPAARRAADRGLAYLRELGFAAGEGGEIHESVFIVDGGAGLDLLEQCVRDRIGIYDLPHGTHIAQAAAWIFSAYNRVLSPGASDAGAGHPMELSLHFSKPPALRYNDYRQAIGAAVESLLRTMPAVRPVLWQRKLGLGRSREFILRLSCGDLPEAGELAAEILRDANSPLFGEGADGPALLVKELLA